MSINPTLPVLDFEAFAESAPTVRVRSLMAAAFERQLPSILAELEAGVENAAAPTQWRDAVHKLKGSCATLGGHRIADCLARWEGVAVSMTPTERQQANEALRPELVALSKALQDCLN